MEKKIKTIKYSKTERVPVYTSEDGTEFFSESLCIEYENQIAKGKAAEEAKNAFFNSGVKVKDNSYYYIETESQYELFLDYIKKCFSISSDRSFSGPDWYFVDVEMFYDDLGDSQEREIIVTLSDKKSEYNNIVKRWNEFFGRFED